MRLDIGLFSVLSTAILLSSPAAAVNFRFYSSSSCTGSSINVNNVGAEQCGIVNFNAYSVYFDGVPTSAKGQVYSSSGCSSYVTEGGGGGYCISTYISGGSVLKAANWFYRKKKLARRDETNDLGPTRYSVRYELPDSTTREVEVPPAQLERAVKLMEENNYEALAEFPVYVKDQA